VTLFQYSPYTATYKLGVVDPVGFAVVVDTELALVAVTLEVAGNPFSAMIRPSCCMLRCDVMQPLPCEAAASFDAG